MASLERNLVRGYGDARRRGAEAELKFRQQLHEAVQARAVELDRVSVRTLFEEAVPDGRELVTGWARGEHATVLQESAVSTAAFANTVMLLTVERALEAYEDPEYIGDNLVTVIPTRKIHGGRMMRVAPVGGEALKVNEGERYPNIGLSEEYIDTPPTAAYGGIVEITQQTVIADETGQVLSQAEESGRAARIVREKLILDAVVGATNTHVYNGVAYNTYLSSGAWTNVKTSNALVDYTDVDAAKLILSAITDPVTGEPIAQGVGELLVPRALETTARTIVSATEVRIGDGASATVQTLAANPLPRHNIWTNEYVSLRSGSSTTWFFGNFRKAFAWMEAWPFRVEQQNADSNAAFERGIVARFKGSLSGSVAVIDPRRVCKCTA